MSSADTCCRTKNPFDCDDMSPIAEAVNTELQRQAYLLFHGALDEISLSRSHTLSASASASQLVTAAVTGDIWDEDRPPAALARSRTDAKLQGQPAPLSTYLVRAASARAGATPPTTPSPRSTQTPHNAQNPFASPRAAQNPFASPAASPRAASRPQSRGLFARPGSQLFASRPASSLTAAQHSPRSLSSRVGMIVSRSSSRAVSGGEPLPKGIINDLNSIPQIVVDELPADFQVELTDEEYKAKCDEIFELVKRKFLKHIVFKPINSEKRKCMCSDDCIEAANVYADRYGRVGNTKHVKPGFYCIEHLVEIFIDAYDEEKYLDCSLREQSGSGSTVRSL